MDMQKERPSTLLAANEKLVKLQAEARARRDAVRVVGMDTAVFPREKQNALSVNSPSVNGKDSCPQEKLPEGDFCISPQKGIVQNQNDPTASIESSVIFPREKSKLTQLFPGKNEAIKIPDRIGWESEPLTGHLRQIEARRQAKVEKEQRQQQFDRWQAETNAALMANAHLRDAIHIFGHTLDAIARAKRVGEGRVWLLARYIDAATGEGRVNVALLKQKLVDEWKVLSWKRLRQIMNTGEGIFWHRDKSGKNLYYHSEARVARAFDIGQLNGFAVAIPIKDLLGNIKSVRALFYDGFHSAREEGYGNPITRGTMAQRGNGDGRTQRSYEELRGIETKANYVNVDLYSKEAWAWEKGREDTLDIPCGPAFRHVDFNGRLGHNPARKHRKKGQQHWHNIYILRRMANSYHGTLEIVVRGKKWTNRKIENLCYSMHVAGSFEEYEMVQIYHDTEKKAYKSQKKNDDIDAYYPQVVGQVTGASDIWGVRTGTEAMPW